MYYVYQLILREYHKGVRQQQMTFMISLKCCQLSEICIHINSYSALKTSNIVQLFCRDGGSANYDTTHQLTSTDDEPHYMKVSAL